MLSISGGDVRNGPAGLFPDRLLGRVEQRQQTRQGLTVEDGLRLRVVTGDNVADRSERRLHHIQRAVHEQLDKAVAHARVNDLLNFLIGSVAQVRYGPAGVRQHVHIGIEQQRGEYGQCGLHFGKLHRRILAAAQIRQAPHCVPRHRESTLFGKNSMRQKKIFLFYFENLIVSDLSQNFILNILKDISKINLKVKVSLTH